MTDDTTCSADHEARRMWAAHGVPGAVQCACLHARRTHQKGDFREALHDGERLRQVVARRTLASHDRLADGDTCR